MGDTNSTTRPSGRFLLRIDPALHGELRDAAAAEGLSLNEYCARKLAAPEGGMGGMAWDGARATVDRAAEVAGDALVAVAVYGSWARHEAGAESDVDVLVVVERHLEIRRGLYRAWDEEPVTWDGREVEPHLVHLPDALEPAGGLWGEVALDGVVLFDPDLRLTTTLSRVRRDIAEGRLIRKRSHGQPYWVRAA